MNIHHELCNGICLTAFDIGMEAYAPADQVAYAHPDCEAHGDPWWHHSNPWDSRPRAGITRWAALSANA